MGIFPLYCIQRSFHSQQCQSICDKTWKLPSWFARDFILSYFCLLLPFSAKTHKESTDYPNRNKESWRKYREEIAGFTLPLCFLFRFLISRFSTEKLRFTLYILSDFLMSAKKLRGNLRVSFKIHFVFSISFLYEYKETEKKLRVYFHFVFSVPFPYQYHVYNFCSI